MNRAWWLRWGGVAVIVVLAGIFSWLNSGETVALHFGLFVVYQLPIVTLCYLAFLLGMITMFLLGLRHDLEVRRVLREQGAAPPQLPPAPSAPPPSPTPPDELPV